MQSTSTDFVERKSGAGDLITPLELRDIPDRRIGFLKDIRIPCPEKRTNGKSQMSRKEDIFKSQMSEKRTKNITKKSPAAL